MEKTRSNRQLEAEVEALRIRLEEAEETLRAITNNEIDALVVNGSQGQQVFTLQGAEQPYRVFVESMNEGAVTILSNGTILYCNTRFAEMLERPLGRIMGASFFDLLVPQDRMVLRNLVRAVDPEGCMRESLLATSNKKEMPVYLSIKPLTPEMEILCVVVTDLTELKQAEEALRKSKEGLEFQVQERTAELQIQFTDLKLAEEKTKRLTALIQEERDRLSAVINSIQEEVWFADAEGRFTLTNQSAVRDFNLASLNGVMVERLAQSLEVYRPDGSPRPVEESPPLRALQGEIVRNQEEMIRIPASGELRYREVNAAPVRNAANTIIGSVSLVRDITERKRLERALQQSERLYRGIGESTNYGVWACDPDGRNIYASESFLKMVGLTQEECSSFGWGNMLHPDDAEQTIAAWQECVRTEDKWDREHRYRGVDGRYHYVLARGIPVRDDQGHITCWAGINLDIDHLKQIQKDLRQSRDQLELRVQERTQELSESEETTRAQLMEIETYYNLTPIGLCILDKELRYVRVNERLADINGLPVSAHLGRTIRETVPAIADMAEETANRIMNTGESFSNIEFTVETAERPGISRTTRTTWFPLKDTHGQVTSIGVMVEEITEQRQLEAQLRQSQKMEAIGTLAGGVAHDFNNILAAIIGFGEMVEEDLPPESPSIPRMQRILSAASRGTELVRQILAFSRKAEPMRTPLSLAPLVKDTIQFLRASLPTTIEIKLSMKAARDTILASPAELQQVLMNLVTNASFAMKEKGGILGINVTNVDFEPDSPVFDTDVEPGEYVQIIVTDTGSGIAPHVMKRIFEPFFTTKEVGEGTGMGLPVVYGVVKSLHGTITVESEPGAGSTFRVFLPIARTDEKSEGREAQVAPKGTERILFVDDEEMLTEWGQAALERLGYSVTALTDSTEALKLFSSDPSRFDLVITDQTMPKLTGMDFARKLLTIRNNIPIILYTGHSDSTSREKAKEAGIREFLMKPLEKQQLAEAIRRVLQTTEPET